MSAALTTGFGLGFLVAAQVGPIWLFCARTALRWGFGAGLAIGLGAATVDTAYAALGVPGAARLLEMPGLRVGLGLVGAVVLTLLGLRTLWFAWRPRSGGSELDADASSPLRGLRISLLATASNPLTIATWGAIFAAAAAAGVVRTASTAVALLAGVGVGSLTWFSLLSAGMAVLRRRLGLGGLRLADVVAGTGIVGFAGWLGWQALRGHT